MLAVRRVLAVLGAVLAVAIVAGAAIAFVTFGTGRSESAEPPGPVASIIASSMASPTAPAAFRNRPPFRSCGHVEVARTGSIPPPRIACLSSTPTEGRELVVVSSTTEGDPIVRYFRTGPDITGVEIYEDATGDRFGGAWRSTSCRSGRIDQSGACA